MIYTDYFAYKPTVKTLEEAPEASEEVSLSDKYVAFIQIEKEDEEKQPLKKFVKFIKWLRNKKKFDSIVLHSFGHLSESKATPEFTREFIDKIEVRLKEIGLEVFQTPFGYFLDLNLRAPGYSLARVFKDI